MKPKAVDPIKHEQAEAMTFRLVQGGEGGGKPWNSV
jgi:hypothetical protein